MELQKLANQGRRCTWEKLSAIKANCGIELALDECVAILNHMRRLKKSADRAAASSYHALGRFNASRRIPSWNCIARENSTGSLEEDLLTDATSSLHQGVGGSTGVPPSARNLRAHRSTHDGSDSESESVDLHSWTRSGGPLMRTTSANLFIDFVQNLDVDAKVNKGLMAHPNSPGFQMGGRDPSSHSSRMTTPDEGSEYEFDQRGLGNRTAVNGSSIMVTEGDLLQPERILNGLMLNVVKKEDLALSGKSHGSGNYSPEVAECVQLDCPEKDDSSASEYGDDDASAVNCLNETVPIVSATGHSSVHDDDNQGVVDG